MSTRQVAETLGVPYHQVDRWVRGQVVGPRGKGSGSRRRWSANDVLTARVVAATNAALANSYQGGDLAVAWRHDSLRSVATVFVDAHRPDFGYIALVGRRARWCPTGRDLLDVFTADRPAAVVIDVAAAVGSLGGAAPLTPGGPTGAAPSDPVTSADSHPVVSDRSGIPPGAAGRGPNPVHDDTHARTARTAGVGATD